MNAENEELGLLQKVCTECKGYAGAQRAFNPIWKERDSAHAGLLEKILDRDNLNKAYKRVKSNKGCPGIDGMTVDEAFQYFREHKKELIARILNGNYTPSPVMRVEIPKPDGKKRKLGVPTVIDRTIQQAICQQLTPIYEPLFADTSYGYRPGRSAHDAILKAKEYISQGYTRAVDLDLEKYFDTLNHELLLNILRRNVKDERVIQLIKRYLKSGVMVDGVVMDTEEGSPQGGPMSPLLANIYLNEFDREFTKRGVKFVRYADDIILFAKSWKAAERLLGSSIRYLEGVLKLTINREKSHAVSVYYNKKRKENFKFLGFTFAKGRPPQISIHPKALKKFKQTLIAFTSRKNMHHMKETFEDMKLYVRGWMNYYGIANMARHMEKVDEHIRHRIRQFIWLQWKKPKTKLRMLLKLKAPADQSFMAAYSSKGKWSNSNLSAVKCALPNKMLENLGYYDASSAYQQVHGKY